MQLVPWEMLMLSLNVFLKINFQSSSDGLHGFVVCIVKTDSKKLPKKELL